MHKQGLVVILFKLRKKMFFLFSFVMLSFALSCSSGYSAKEICYRGKILNKVKEHLAASLAYEMYSAGWLISFWGFTVDKKKENKMLSAKELESMVQELFEYWKNNISLREKYNAESTDKNIFSCSASLEVPIPVSILRKYFREDFKNVEPNIYLVKYKVEVFKSQSGKMDLFKVEIDEVEEVEN